MSLHITYEIEIFNALDKWLKAHNYEERKVFASSLLLKVRLCLLSENSLKCLLNESSALTRNDDCVTILQNVLKGENRYHQSKLATRYRYCDQYKFEILFCGGRSDYSCLQSVNKVDGTNLSKLDTTDARMLKTRANFKSVYLRGEIFVFYGKSNGDVNASSVEKYSILTKTWQWVANASVHLDYFCICGLIDKVYICGGTRHNKLTHTRVSYTDRVFDTKYNSFKTISNMNYRKENAACSAYQGKVVVSG